jgi:hypothetical protein
MDEKLDWFNKWREFFDSDFLTCLSRTRLVSRSSDMQADSFPTNEKVLNSPKLISRLSEIKRAFNYKFFQFYYNREDQFFIRDIHPISNQFLSQNSGES